MGSNSEVKAGCIVVRHRIIGAFKVITVYADKTADIRQFNNSTQTLTSAVYGKVPIAELSVFTAKEEEE